MNLGYNELKLFKKMVEKWMKGTQTCGMHNGGYIKKMYACRFNAGTNNSGYPYFCSNILV